MTSSRFAYLDGLRGLAALIVTIRHTSHFWGANPSHIYLAVDVFFLLSGFVIAHSYEAKLASGSLSAAGFMRARLLRLMPAYLVAVAVGGILKFVESGDPIGTAILAAKAAFLVPSSGETLFPLVFVAWSLFDEVVVNAVYAALRPRLTTKRLFAISAACFFGVTAAALRNGHTDLGYHGTVVGTVEGFVRAGFGICLGIALYRVRDAAWKRLPSMPAPLAVASICAILLAPSIGPQWLFDVAALLCFPPLLLQAARTQPRRAGAMLALGLASYPAYLLHGAVHVQIEAWWDVSRWAPYSGIAFLCLIFGLSLAFERWVERPLRQLARRLLEAGHLPWHAARTPSG